MLLPGAWAEALDYTGQVRHLPTCVVRDVRYFHSSGLPSMQAVTLGVVMLCAYAYHDGYASTVVYGTKCLRVLSALFSTYNGMA
eukprot:3725114-Rhodomonas_salina.4